MAVACRRSSCPPRRAPRRPCGVFGNIPDDDVHRTIDALPQFCARDATVIWTRHRGPPDLTPTIRGWFAGTGFVELGFESTVAEADRKSTRLNSSHVKISYAVFCL